MPKLKVYVNGGLGTLRCLKNFLKFNYTKIYQSNVLRLGPNLKLLQTFSDFSKMKLFSIIPIKKNTDTSVSIPILYHSPKFYESLLF